MCLKIGYEPIKRGLKCLGNFDIGPNLILISNKVQGVSTARTHGPSVTTVFMLLSITPTNAPV